MVGFNVSEDGDYCANSLLYKPVPASPSSHYSSVSLKSPFPLIFMAWWLEMRRHLGSTLRTAQISFYPEEFAAFNDAFKNLQSSSVYAHV